MKSAACWFAPRWTVRTSALGEPVVRTVHFDIDPFRKHCLLNGLDDIGLTMEKKSEIDDFEKKQKESQPWLHAAE